MKLHIENLAKIDVADIKLDGITVIVGDNNTGKSTIGKALWAMFDVFFSSTNKVMVMRYLYISQQILVATNLISIASDNKPFQDIINDMIIKKITFSEIKSSLITKYKIDETKVDWSNLEHTINTFLNISDEELFREILLNEFKTVFNGQFSSYYYPNIETKVRLTIKGKEISTEISQEKVKNVNNIILQNNAYLIDNPSQFTYLENDQFNTILQIGNGLMTYKLCQSILNSFKSNYNKSENIVEELLSRKYFDKIEHAIIKLMEGTINYSDKDGVRFISNDYPQYPLHLSNLSQGLKALALLQSAFKYGTIKERDVLILDEPEIHLHPDWQIKYAELIVLLQKAFNLTVLLTTHSPDFAQAIRLYSQKYGLSGELNAYISKEQEDGTVTMDQVPQDDWDEIFEKFAKSFDTLMALRSDLENPDSDSEESKSASEGR